MTAGDPRNGGQRYEPVFESTTCLDELGKRKEAPDFIIFRHPWGVLASFWDVPRRIGKHTGRERQSRTLTHSSILLELRRWCSKWSIVVWVWISDAISSAKEPLKDASNVRARVRRDIRLFTTKALSLLTDGIWNVIATRFWVSQLQNLHALPWLINNLGFNAKSMIRRKLLVAGVTFSFRTLPQCKGQLRINHDTAG
ncbi:hypothetical protein L218DRAFT_949512 [Marasmius fiardii PR-910]|nr:hypothetical protein L218DRAFT_949512 [Marasmius fiardii PR-910]